MTKRALVPIADGTEEIEAVSTVDTLRRAGVHVTVASVMGKLEIVASRRTRIVADALIAEAVAETYDLIALPGGIPGAEHLASCPPLIRALQAQRDAGRLYAAICASPAVALLPHGLLSGRRATCFPSFLERLEAASDVTAALAPVVVDGNLITSQGPGTAIAFGLALVEALFPGTGEAKQIGRRMLVDAQD